MPVFIIILINTILSLLLLLALTKRTDMKSALMRSFIIFMTPVVGAVFFAGAFIVERILSRKKSLTYGDITFDDTRYKKKQLMDFIDEIDIVPLEEAFKVSEKHDRRKSLLETLKKDYSKNISSIMRGLNNEDTETSHYVATVIMSITSDYLNLLGKLKSEYTKNFSKGNTAPAKDYLTALKDYMQSDIMDNIDKLKYINIYNEVLETLFTEARNEVELENIVYITEILTEINKFDDAEKWAERTLELFSESDEAYYASMKLYYAKGDPERFKELLRRIMKSNINITNETIQIIRFYTYKR